MGEQGITPGPWHDLIEALRAMVMQFHDGHDCEMCDGDLAVLSQARAALAKAGATTQEDGE